MPGTGTTGYVDHDVNNRGHQRNFANKMHILVITDRYFPEISAASFRVRDHAREWIDSGHEVTVVTCVPNFPHGRVFEGYRNRLYQEEWIDGVRVIRVGSYMTANVGTVKRTLDYMSFALMASLMCWRFPKFDVILATSPPLFVGIAGYVVSRLRRRPWVFEIRDLWPASIKAVGASNSRILDLFEDLELFLYRKADRILALTESFRLNLERRGVPSEKIDVVTNGVDTRRFDPTRVQENAKKRLGVGEGQFLVGYIGTVGMAHGLETLLDAAELCIDDPKITFLIMGEGAEREKLETQALDRGLRNVIFHDFVPQEEVPSFLAALDVGIVHLKPDPLFKTVIPSKLFEYMAMAKPMVYAVEGESAEIVKAVGAGLCVPPGDPYAIASAVRELRREPERLAEMGRLGREAVERQYARSVKAGQAVQCLERALKRSTESWSPGGSNGRS